ncbi:putative Mfs allantoate transporter [Aspergillus mulundensis]|uniref:Putative Mfs allantoate transporter n=1 Tax=Aspergillus mulundensis TaxID=1810919 RepID=A0A3D8QBT7_9EURO|nr:putative Mfs allantoate transporter [Aspergillus mulundensis]RDW59325.1 putative Mfs allantoate transporter [Aspergillus mulundensis]
MSAPKEVDEAISSSDHDHGFGSSRSMPVNWLSRFTGKNTNINLNEVGKDYFQRSLQYDEAQLERDAVKVRRKLDFYVLPLMMITYMLSFLDKQTLNYSNAYGLQEDTNMTGDNYSWVSSALYIGWLAAVFNFAGFFAIRFFLGLLEAVVSPAFIILTSMLWTREEQSLRSSYWLSMNGISAIVGALLAYGAGHAEGLAVPQWKLIYLIVGSMTIAWGFVIYAYLPDGPHNAKMLSEYERIVAVWRISRNQTGLKQPQINTSQIKEALVDPRQWLLYLMAICYGILNGGVANFLAAIIKGFGYSPLRTSLLQTPVGAFELVMVIAFGYLSKVPNMLGVTIVLSCIPGLAGLIGIMKISIERHRFALVAMCWLQGILGAPVILNWTLPGLNTAGHTKRSTVLGIYFVLYCAGNIAGPHFFLPDETPRYSTAIKGLAGSYAGAMGLQVIYTVYCAWENRRKQRVGLLDEARANATEVAMEGFEDLTDKENRHFKYRI